MNSRKEQIEKASESQNIYEPKYGGKDHSGYDTLLKYEVNYERMEAFEAGAEWADKHPMSETFIYSDQQHQILETENIKLKSALNKIGMLQMGELDYTTDFFEQCKNIVREAMEKK